MKKKVLAILLMLTLAMSGLSGCGVFGSGDNNGGGSGGEANIGNKDNPLQITDKYTVEAPEGVDYDTVHVVMCVPNGDNLVSEFSQEGVTSMWVILYSKGEEMVGEWDIYVLSGQEGVDMMLKSAGERADHYYIPEADPNVMMWYVDADGIEANVISYASFGMLNDPCPPAEYAEFNADIYGGIVLGVVGPTE